MGSNQRGGIDAFTASDLVSYYSIHYAGDESQAIANEYRWRLHSLYLQSESHRDFNLMLLGEFFLGDRDFRKGKYDEPVDIVAAHAIFNYLNTQPLSDFYKRKLQEISKLLSDAEMKAALKLARTCVESDFPMCLSAIDTHYKKMGG